MSSHPRTAPKHRAATPHRAPAVARTAAIKTSLTLTSMAVVATGVAVGTGSLSLPAVSVVASGSAARPPAPTASVAGASSSGASASDSPSQSAGRASSAGTSPGGDVTGSSQRTQAQPQAPAAGTQRDDLVTRSDERDATDSLKASALSLGQGNTLSRSESLSDQSPQVIAQALLGDYGWSQDQFGCLDSLWTRESGWNVHADNPSSSAYGIPQALPGSKMASAGSDWENNAVTQIKWGLGYIEERYGSPCGAWGHSQSSGFY